MNSRFRLWASVLIASLVVTGLSMRFLAVHNVAFSESLVVRGVSCLLLVLAFARARGLKMRPKSPRTQVLRALLAGLALTFFSLSYSWLTASTVAVIANVDVPLLLFLGPWIGVPASARTRVGAIAAIALLVWYFANLEPQPNRALGLASLLIGTVMLCFGYMYIKKSMAEENEAITTLVPALAIIVYGGVEYFIFPVPAHQWSADLWLAGILSGVGMFGAYLASMRLYTVTDLASAEFPTLLSSLLMQPLEALVLNEPMRFTAFLPSLGFVGVIYVLVKDEG